MRYIYFASGAIAVPLLETMIKNGDPPCAVVTADTLNPQNHNHHNIAHVAHGAGLVVLSSRDEDGIGYWCREEDIDVAVLFSFGQKIPVHWLKAPKHGFINIHPSALPRWRGASPIAHTIWFGDRSLGVSMVQMDHRWDHGPILAQHTIPVPHNATTASLTTTVANTVSQVFPTWWRQWQNQELVPYAQSDQGITQAPRLKKDHGRICFRTMNAITIERTVRAMNPWPSAWFTFRGETVKVIHASLPIPKQELTAVPPSLSPRCVTSRCVTPGCVVNRKLWIATAHGLLSLDKIQRPGRNVVDGVAAMNGWRMKPMTMLYDDHSDLPPS